MDGKKVQLGGTVDLGGALTGTVVAVIEEGAGPNELVSQGWRHLAAGALLHLPGFGLVHHLYTDMILL